MSALLPSTYRLRLGSPLDRALLLKFARRAYREIEPERSGDTLPSTIDRYLGRTTPIWWIETRDPAVSAPSESPATIRTTQTTRTIQTTQTIRTIQPLPHRSSPQNPVACLWLGSAISTDDEPKGHVLLIYVEPDHRRQGLATYLLEQAENWAKQRGDRGIGLQVMAHNDAAIALYRKLGYATISQWMSKPFVKP